MLFRSLSTARNLQTSYNNELLQIMKYPEYATALESQTLAHSIGVDSNGNPVIVDLADYPHAMVCGTTNSGKTVSLKCMIASLLRYQPYEVNLLLVDRLLHFSAFADVPHIPLLKIRKHLQVLCWYCRMRWNAALD